MTDEYLHRCTEKDPWTKEKGKQGYHKEAVEVYSDFEYSRYECPICKASWKNYWEDMK